MHAPMGRFTLVIFALGVNVLLVAEPVFPAEPKPASETQGGHLIIQRSFELGGLPIVVLIDGRRVATIAYNRDYSAPIAPGPHTVSVIVVPERPPTKSAPVKIRCKPWSDLSLQGDNHQRTGRSA
jgi:hypothetical protein